MPEMIGPDWLRRLETYIKYNKLSTSNTEAIKVNAEAFEVLVFILGIRKYKEIKILKSKDDYSEIVSKKR